MDHEALTSGRSWLEKNVNDDDWMLEHYGYTREELVKRMMDGDDIGGDFDGDPIDLLD